ncbi:hypothetical protein TCAL_03169 [Tigriopus californicus]|uniref:Uncharacterized protein n=1 Tax=Tigriopus californicus TaxID=6832 RepID=A0A553N708_TIGCA|nr:hypothetical protein TCAL_03169 [Tigriopus californicus]|eukprot:TCALIF_03169-PA protein Name:"Protein of unknown function" AED:0.14 eAED:0.14 QI:0/0.5/0.66/0.66/0.5/0.33/3/238/112
MLQNLQVLYSLIDLLNRLIAQAKMEQVARIPDTDIIPMVSGPDMDEAVSGITELEDFLRHRRTPESSSPLGSATMGETRFHYPSFQKKKQNLRRMKELQKLHFQRMRRQFDA